MGMWIAHLVLSKPLQPGSLTHNGFAVLVVAGAICSVLAFAGVYSADPGPINIAQTAALVRGMFYAAGLSMATTYYRHPKLSAFVVLSATVAVLLLVLRRDLSHVVATTTHLDTFSKAPSRGNEHCVQDVYHLPKPLGAFSMPSRLADTMSIGYLFLKRTIDLSGALLLVILLAPVSLVIAALVKLESRGPIFFRHERVGRSAVPFRMWKFRTMYKEVPRYEPSPISDSDPRLTRVGRVLRRLSIDELPQLLNVIAGDMSLVGPRPEMPFIVGGYGPYERLRLRAKPGITGLWQISPARAMPIHHNLGLDLYYIERASAFMDIAILLRTLTAVARGIGAT